MARNTTRAAPFNEDAERAVLGAMMLNRSAVEDALNELRPIDFYVPKWSRTFEAISSLVGRGIPVDPLTVATELNGVQGAPTRVELLEAQGFTPLSMNIGGYIRLMVECSARRYIIGEFGDCIERAYDPASDPDALIARVREVADHIDMPQHGRGRPDLDAYEFVDQEHEYQWVVEYLLEEMDRLLLVAPEGYGKSTLLRQLAVTISQGIHPFKFWPIPPKRVMLLDLENPEMLVRRKLRPLLDRCLRTNDGEVDPGRLRIVCKPEGIDVTRRSDAIWLMERITANKPEVLCVGPIYKLHEAEDEKASDARRVMKVLDRIRSRFKCTLVMETHAPHESFAKGGTLRPAGSRLWIRWPEFVMTLQPASAAGGTLADFGHARGPRDEREWPPRLRKGGAWPWTPDDPNYYA